MKIVACKNCGTQLKMPEIVRPDMRIRCPNCGRGLILSGSQPNPAPAEPQDSFPPCEKPKDIASLPYGEELVPQDLREDQRKADDTPVETSVTLDSHSRIPEPAGDAGEDIWTIMEEEKRWREQTDVVEEEEMIGKSGKSPLVEILAYPATLLGLSLGFVFLGPKIIRLAMQFVSAMLPAFAPVLFIPFLLISMITKFIELFTTAYMFWYICVSIERSARGERHIPETLWMDEGFWDSFRRLCHVLACVLICLGPAMINVGWYGYSSDFWVLLLPGVFFLPAAMLGVSIRHSIDGLNPYFILKTICKAPRGYLMLAVIFEASVAVVAVFVLLQFAPLPGVLKLLLRGGYIYMLFVLAHITGRFFFNNRDKLEWLENR
ncbi:hypothetical protein [Anaerohalosphaera lusitana]|uniref:hypothetical protein n=1 Tax=Anaerohalosphaera lusitana TaxID=1936003 RepID=UPI0011BABE9D|nr:hypothetical protein [Anaerohalosphaera lusitana]